MCKHIGMPVYMHMYIYIRTRIHPIKHMHMCIYIRIHIHAIKHIHMCIYIRIHIHAIKYMHMYIHMHICILYMGDAYVVLYTAVPTYLILLICKKSTFQN